jgi:putrescine---pyruvate transaminase
MYMESRDQFNQHLMHPWANLPALGEDDSTPQICRAEGVYLYDNNGHQLLDGPGGMWCMQVGYGRSEIAEAVSKQIMELGYASTFSVFHPGETELAHKIASVTPGDLNRIFFTTGGSTAVDAALRLCQLANNIKGKPHRKHILCRQKGYHGSTYLAASVCGKERDKSAMDIQTGNIHFLTAPSVSQDPLGRSEAEFCDFLIAELETTIASIGADNIMCFIAEPVLGSGGVIVPPEGYNRRCWEVVKQHGIVYIADEVVTGFGRLGHWFSSEAVFGVRPDMITFAKGVTSGYVPLGGFAVSDAFMADISLDNANGNIFSTGFTWSANPVSCAAALAVWDIIVKENLLEHVREVAPYFQDQLRTLRGMPLVKSVRGTGLMAAIELEAPESLAGNSLLDRDYTLGELVDRHCYQLGLIVRPLINVCVLSPPLILTLEQVDELVAKLRAGIEAANNSLNQ